MNQKRWIIPAFFLSLALFAGPMFSAAKELSKKALMPRWYSGKIAFVSPNRVTLDNGFQFFLSSAPVYLNNEEASQTALVAGQDVLVRFNSSLAKVTGIWIFHFSSEKPAHIFWSRASARRIHEKRLLRVVAQAESGGALSAQLLGVTEKFSLKEKQAQTFTGNIPLPGGLAVPETHLLFTWSRRMENGKNFSETFLSPEPVSFYTIPPKIEEIAPRDGAAVPENAPMIFLGFDPREAPLDPASIRLILDGNNVSSACYRTSDLIFYYPDSLIPGWHHCFLSAKMMGGLESYQKRWSFRVLR